jgi:hypothetical protein
VCNIIWKYVNKHLLFKLCTVIVWKIVNRSILIPRQYLGYHYQLVKYGHVGYADIRYCMFRNSCKAMASTCTNFVVSSLITVKRFPNLLYRLCMFMLRMGVPLLETLKGFCIMIW